MRMLSVLVSRSKVTVANDVHLNSQLVYSAPDIYCTHGRGTGAVGHASLHPWLNCDKYFVLIFVFYLLPHIFV